MEKSFGTANHIYKDRTVTRLAVSTMSGEDLGFVCIRGYGGESVLIHSLSQLDELYAIASLALDSLTPEAGSGQN